MRMERRRLLRTTATGGIASLAGCLSSGFSPMNSKEPTKTPPSNRPNGFWRWINIEGINPPPDDYQIGFELTVPRPWVTAENSAYIKATLTNEADVERQFDPIVLYSMVPKNRGIRIYADDEDLSPVYKPECTGDNGKADGKVGHHGGNPLPVTLSAGESVETVGIIADDREVSGCFPTGVYRFPVQQSVQPENGEGKQQYQFSFSIGIQGENK